ncbi:MAG: hypothetical protein DRQ98_05105 [Gammaproteobacteria bacterium]|nr:MAG: hypothetical protein DRQ98_05105 [Gammaproteobacteria bacterium]
MICPVLIVPRGGVLMRQTEWLQETRLMRFEEAYGGWTESRLTQEEAALLLGVCARTFRRYIDRYEEEGLDGLIDKRLSQVSHRRAPVDEVMRLVRDGLGGREAGQIINGNERYDIYVSLAKSFREDQQAIVDLRLQSPTGAWVRLGDVADIAIDSGPPQVRRNDVQRRVVIQANVQGRDMGSVVSDIRQSIEQEVDLPPGYSVDIGGQFEN